MSARIRVRWMASSQTFKGRPVEHCYQNTRDDQWATLCGSRAALEVDESPESVRCAACVDARARMGVRATEYQQAREPR